MQIETFYPKSQQEWRQWLLENHATKQSVWVVMYKKQSGKPSILWTDAVDEAICFGWIDSLKKSVDSESSVQFFSKRKAKSGWSKINKDKVTRLIEDDQMTDAGLATIDLAKQNGSWSLLDEVEELLIPTDLESALKKTPRRGRLLFKPEQVPQKDDAAMGSLRQTPRDPPKPH